MGKKLVALLVMCIVVVAAMNVHEVEANAETDTFKNCFVACHKECQGSGNGFTFCEVKCDDECSEKEAAAKLSGGN